MGAEGDGQTWKVHGVQVLTVNQIAADGWDTLVVVTCSDIVPPQALEDFIIAHHELDPGSKEAGAVSVVRCPRVCGGRLVLASAGTLTPYDDVRSIKEAMLAGVQRAMKAGALRPAVVLQPHPRFPRAPLVALLAALEALYVPLQIRESYPERAHKVSALGVYAEGLMEQLSVVVATAVGLEIARGVARDIGGADPERMTPLRAAQYVRETFADSPVRVRVLDDAARIREQYPLFAAVSRAADSVERHRGCIVFLEYEPKEYDRTLMFVGKGVTYDTGGCDIKAGGAMAGMSRDKCGAAAVAGFFKACAELRGRVKAVGALALVRNSVGEEAYVADELLRCRAGLPVRVGNTDAEGRMAMADLLAEMAERAASERCPHVYTVATLTGHAARAVGEGYSIVLDNHAARAHTHAHKLQAAGDLLADMFEVSTIRREDLRTHQGKAAGDAIHQADNKPSTASPRGHQAPAAFLLLASGLARGSVPYSHIDMAASGGWLPDPPTAAPLLALAAHAGLLPPTPVTRT